MQTFVASKCCSTASPSVAPRPFSQSCTSIAPIGLKPRSTLFISKAPLEEEVVEVCISASDSVQAPIDNATALKESRKFLSILPPFFSRETTLEELAPGLWSMVQPLRPPGQADIRLRCTLATLSNGTLALIGPIAPTQEFLDMITSFNKGPVSHIIVPNTSPEHFLYAPAVANAFPEASLWVCPGFMEGKGVPLPGRSLLFGGARNRGQIKSMGVDPWPAELEGELEAVVFDVPFFMEAALCLTKHRTLMLADTAICLSASDPEYANLPSTGLALAKQIGLYDRLGPVTRVVFEKYSEQGKAWVNNVLEKCDFDMIVPAHGSAPVGTRGDGGSSAKAAFKDCFDFLFE